MQKMETPAPLALPEHLEVTEIVIIDEVFTITAHSTRKYPCCPLCGTPAQRFHSHSLRQITDLPSGGKRVCLRVLVRKCFCDVSTCVRKIFAERLTPFVEPLARVTARLFQVVQAIGLADFRDAGSASSRAIRNTDLLDDSSSSDHGASNRSHPAGGRAWDR